MEITQQMVFFLGRFNSQDYLSILSHQIHHMWNYFRRETVFRDDTALIHRAKDITKWHEENSNGFEHLIWPPQSPDLNILKICGA